MNDSGSPDPAQQDARPRSNRRLARSGNAADGRPKPRRARDASKRRKRETTPDVDMGPLENYIAFHLRLAQELALRSFTKRLGKADFRPGLFALLMVIKLNPGISQSALGRAIGRDKSTISPLIRELQDKALIARRPSSGDRRSVTLSLTRAGQTELAALLGHVEAHDRRLDDIVGDDKPKLIALLRKIADEFA
jgi:DNA-binding MarR family transcriptional regulator